MMAQPAASLDDIKETLSDHSDDVPEPEAKRQKIEEPTEAVANPEAEKKNLLNLNCEIFRASTHWTTWFFILRSHIL